MSIDDAPQKLGLTQEQFEHLLSEAARTGLGVACLNSRAGFQPGTRKGEDCTKLEACCECEMRWVPGTAENLADLILLNEDLESHETSVAESDRENWLATWGAWLAFSQVVLRKAALGETASELAKARVLAEERRSTYVSVVAV